MQDFIVILIIAFILFLAIRPIMKYKKQTGNSFTCYGCSHFKGGDCNIIDLKDKIKCDIKNK
jgi:FeoB-associated Cys-rich membrane protein